MSNDQLLKFLRLSGERSSADGRGLRICDEAADLIEKQSRRISELEAARIAYASEFAPNADGEPDVGNIHANIRKLKSDAAYWRARAKDAEEYIDESGA